MTNKRGYKRQAYLELGILMIIIVVINFIASFVFFRIDFTKEKRYTLSPSSKELMRDLEDVVFVRVYLSGEFPSGFKRLSTSTRETLDELKAYAGSNLEYEFIDPNADPDPKVRGEILSQLIKQGVTPINLQVKDDKGERQQVIVPGAIMTYRGRQVPVSLLQSQIGLPPEEILNNSVQNLEYQLVNNIKKVTLTHRPEIAFIHGHGELDTFQTNDIIHALNQYYAVDQVNLRATGPEDLLKYKMIVVAKPRQPFNEGEKFNIDQYIMNGGRVLWLVENLDIDMDTVGRVGTMMTSNYNLNLEDQLFTYGARINNDLIQDMQCAPIPIMTGNIGGQPQTQMLPWLFYPIFIPTSAHPVVKNLDGIRSEFVSSIDTIAVKGIKKTPLLQSSKYAKLLNAPVRVSLQLLGIEPNPEQFNKKNVTSALLLEGSFTSVFKNRLVPQNDSVKFLEESKPTRMIIVSDGDMIKNQISPRDSTIMPLGYDRFTKTTFGNKTFIQNCIDFLADDGNLISARSKDVKLRMLDKARAKAEKVKWQTINMVVPMFLVVVFGVILYSIRKRKFAK
jgi:ABC-2 type transport system permease protein